MKVESRNAGSCRVKLVVNAEADETRTDYEQIIQTYVQHGRIPGFRPGHAPRQVIERQYQREIDQDVRRTLVSKLYRQALDSEKLAVVGVVDVGDVIFSPETGISFVLTVDVAPEFKLPKYQKIPVKPLNAAVSDEDVQQQLARLRDSMANYEDTEGAVAAGDIACIDYQATCDGKPLAEVAGECGSLAAGTDFWAKAAEPEFIPGVALALAGLKAGDSREIKVKFEKDFHVEGVRGRKAVYALQVKRVRRCVPPGDADLAKRFGVDDLSALTSRLRSNMEGAARQREEGRQRQEVVDYLLKRTEFDLPQSQVDEETHLMLRQIVGDISQRGGSREFLEQNREEILNNATTSAKDRVRIRYILARIAEEEKLEVSEAEVEASIADMARTQSVRGGKPVTAAELRERLEERHAIETVRADLRGEKAMAFLLAAAKQG